MKDRERIIYSQHPPYCSCLKCNEARLVRLGMKSEHGIYQIPKSSSISKLRRDWIFPIILLVILAVIAWRIYVTI